MKRFKYSKERPPIIHDNINVTLSKDSSREIRKVEFYKVLPNFTRTTGESRSRKLDDTAR